MSEKCPDEVEPGKVPVDDDDEIDWRLPCGEEEVDHGECGRAATVATVGHLGEEMAAVGAAHGSGIVDRGVSAAQGSDQLVEVAS
jgi:hypothetical protein